jgi:predicted Ser/Thr protein kinase
MKLSKLLSWSSNPVYVGKYNNNKCILKFLSKSRDNYVESPEYEIMKILESTNCIPKAFCILDVCYTLDNEIFDKVLIIEYIKGVNLNDLSFEKTDILLVRNICIQIVKGLIKILKLGYVHNDLRLDNLMWNGENIYFIDFEDSYAIDYFNQINDYPFVKISVISPEYKNECEKLKNFVIERKIKHPPPLSDLEDSISHPGSVNLEREYKRLLDCINILMKKVNDIEGLTKISSIHDVNPKNIKKILKQLIA